MSGSHGVLFGLMAIASLPTKLPLATFARILGIHPLHFAGIEFTPENQSAAVCDAGMMQWDWQDADRVGREQIAQAIAEAELKIESYTQFHIAPTWDSEEWQLAERPFKRELVNYGGRAIPFYHSSVPSKWKKIISGGTETRTLISASRPITWSDEDGDGVEETATVTAPVAAGAAPCEIEVYYPGHAGLAQYQIRPALTTVSGTTATITFKRWLAVAEELFDLLNPRPATWADDADFLSAVDVYRHWNDPSAQATLMWEPVSACAVCNGSGCSTCQYAVQSACLYLRSTPDVGQLAWSPATWDSENEVMEAAELALGRGPDIVRLSYYSGVQSAVGCATDMDPAWARAVAYLALTYLDRPACQCTSDVWDYWRDIEDKGKTVEAVRRSDNPFGTMRGAVHAWKRVTDPSSSIIRFASF